MNNQKYQNNLNIGYELSILMTSNKNTQPCCPPKEVFNMEAVVSVDERGQMVLPKAIREAMGIKAGDKLALITKVRDGKVCCINVFLAANLSGMAQRLVMEAEGA